MIIIIVSVFLETFRQVRGRGGDEKHRGKRRSVWVYFFVPLKKLHGKLVWNELASLPLCFPSPPPPALMLLFNACRGVCHRAEAPWNASVWQGGVVHLVGAHIASYIRRHCNLYVITVFRNGLLSCLAYKLESIHNNHWYVHIHTHLYSDTCTTDSSPARAHLFVCTGTHKRWYK